MPTRPEDLVNRALDECAVPEIGDLFEGSVAARAALRVYDPTLRQVFAAAHWNCARKQQQLLLLGDREGQFSDNTVVPYPWRYMYEWPVDSVHARFVYFRPVTSLNEDGTPVINTFVPYTQLVPFVVGSYPRPNDADSSWSRVEGHDPEQTRVILTDQLGAEHVYTGLLQYPDAWDPLLEQAMVSILASRLALPCQPDRAFARQVRQDNILIARQALAAARVRDGNEGWTVQDYTPDWIKCRTDYIGSALYGMLFQPWSSVPGIDEAGGAY